MSYNYRTPADETRITETGIIVKRSRILSSQIVVYTAWERQGALSDHSHQTITTIDGAWYGTVGSRRDDSTFRHLPGGSDERIAAVRAHYNACYAEAHAAILAVFPEAANGRRVGGEIEMYY